MIASSPRRLLATALALLLLIQGLQVARVLPRLDGLGVALSAQLLPALLLKTLLLAINAALLWRLLRGPRHPLSR